MHGENGGPRRETHRAVAWRDGCGMGYRFAGRGADIGCASDVAVSFPTTPGPQGPTETGSVFVRFTEPMRSVSVEIHGRLVAEDRHTERVHVADVPVGVREVGVVAAPPRSLGSWIRWTTTMVAHVAGLIVGDGLLR